MKDKLEKLECHFTWNLNGSSYYLKRLKENLEDISTDEDGWLGPIYNMLGFSHFHVSSTDEARIFFSRAAEAFSRLRRSDRGPWLMVIYANLAWCHYHQKEEAQCQFYLSEVEALMKEYPSGSEAELHPEICAEKGWVLMYDTKVTASDYLRRAVEMQPDMVEWQTAYVLCQEKQSNLVDFVMKLEEAKDRDPENLYLAAMCLVKRGISGEKVDENEIDSLANKVLMKPVSSYKSFRQILKCYKYFDLVDRAITVAEKALEKHPDQRYLKRCAAICYKWKVINGKGSPATHDMIKRAISLHQQVVEEYPESSFLINLHLASMYAKTTYDAKKADAIFHELLDKDLEPAEKQLLYNVYAKHLYFNRNDSNASMNYHMKVVEIQHRSFFRLNSIREVQKNYYREKCPEMKRKLSECLRKNTSEEEIIEAMKNEAPSVLLF